jgi:hypothetical protein
MPSQEHLTRLSLVRYLLLQAKQQLSAPGPSRCIALLHLQDALEMFLDTAAETLGIPGPQREFKNYWSSFAAANPPVTLSMQRAMEKLNRARVALKHHGIRPADDQLEEYVILTHAFADDVCVKCFGIELAEASMFTLIKDDQVRDLLKLAQAELQTGKLTETFVNAAKGLSCGFSAGWRSRLSSRFSLFSLQTASSDRLTRAISNIITDVEREISLLSLG